MTEHLRATSSEIEGLWRAGKYDEAIRCISQNFAPVLVDSLRQDVRCEADANEIVAETIQAFWGRINREGTVEIDSPTSYLWRVLATKKADHFRELKKLPIPETILKPSHSEVDQVPHDYLDFQNHSGQGRQMTPGFQRQAVNIIEGLFDNVEIEESAAAPLVRATLLRMKPGYRAIIESILTDGVTTAAEASAKFGISEVNYRVRKNRAFAQFREEAITASVETGIEWRGISEDSRYQDETLSIDFELTDEDEPLE